MAIGVWKRHDLAYRDFPGHRAKGREMMGHAMLLILLLVSLRVHPNM